MACRYDRLARGVSLEQPMAAKRDEVMTMDEPAKYLKISKSTLYKLAVVVVRPMSSKSLLVPKATRLLTRFNLFTESPRVRGRFFGGREQPSV